MNIELLSDAEFANEILCSPDGNVSDQTDGVLELDSANVTRIGSFASQNTYAYILR